MVGGERFWMFLEVFRMRLRREIRTPGAWGGAQWMPIGSSPAEHLLGAIPGGWAWRRVGPTGAPPGCLHGELWGCISFPGFYARVWSGLATRADVCKSLGFLLANGPGGARLPTLGNIY